MPFHFGRFISAGLVRHHYRNTRNNRRIGKFSRRLRWFLFMMYHFSL